MRRALGLRQMVADEQVGAFGLRLYRLLAERGMSQRALARELGMDNPETVWRWVNGKCEPTYIMLRRIKAALGCTYEELFEG